MFPPHATPFSPAGGKRIVLITAAPLAPAEGTEHGEFAYRCPLNRASREVFADFWCHAKPPGQTQKPDLTGVLSLSMLLVAFLILNSAARMPTSSCSSGDDLLEHIASGDTIGDGFVAKSNTVQDNVFCECEEVIGGDIGSSVNECACAGGFDE